MNELINLFIFIFYFYLTKSINRFLSKIPARNLNAANRLRLTSGGLKIKQRLNKFIAYKMLFIAIVLCTFVFTLTSAKRSPYSKLFWSLSSLPSSIDNSNNNDKQCSDGVCSVDFNKQVPKELESKILHEWNQAYSSSDDKDNKLSTNSNNTDDDSNAIHQATDPTEPTDEATITSSSSTPNTSNDDNNDIDSKVNELIKLGYNKYESKQALLSSNMNIEQAITTLEIQEENKELIKDNVIILTTSNGRIGHNNTTGTGTGPWKKEAAEAALLQTNNNITAAIELLEQEEKIVVDNFEVAVSEMV